jgi:hypothetical protein
VSNRGFLTRLAAKHSIGGDQFLFGNGQNAPLARGQIVQLQAANPNPQQAQGGMANGSRHAADLTIFPLDEFQADPAVRHGLAKPDGRLAGRDLRLRFEQPGATWQRFAALNDEATGEGFQCGDGGNAFHLRPVFAFVGVTRFEQAGVPFGLIAQQQQAFGIRIEPAKGINILGKTKLGDPSGVNWESTP